ncbi:hypothetical protein ANN_03468 [Periplaneta americana]|uniref:PiggyBac transposable element-derived protein 4 C-terminal zinc-ribbon domain-containing protein n=1 Tax=Periplaneta americana TaxID=6978 RepID=A0ABQ8U3B5_PERAM|nr:hypothetical protein ANN_03468 [Periplaneta americana]
MIFMKNLANALVTPHMHIRLNNRFLTFETRVPIRRLLGVEDPVPSFEEKLEKRKTCYTCPPKKQRKTAYMCHCCRKIVCLEDMP